ncbi:MAG: SDR family oxidoreductase [Sphingomonadales bacterium]|nr:SDR family oxidoreductase [Sphingomonadales bacterium]
MHDRLHGRRIVVVGAGTGIGAATVQRLCAEGARVCVADLNLAGAQSVASELRDAGHDAFALPVDVTDEIAVNACFAQAAERLGGLDGCHFNAADLHTIFADSDALAVDLAVFDRTLAVNLRGSLLCTRAALPHLLASGRGAIVYTGSDASDAGDPERPSYAASKSGLNALMRHVASRWGREGLTANCISPGFILTPEMTARGGVPQALLDQYLTVTRSTRLGQVADIAAMVAMLLSDDARWINGQVIRVDGGALLG